MLSVLAGGAFAVATMVCVIEALVAGYEMPWLERAYLASHFHDVAVNSALAMLGAIASGMRALAAIVFAIAYITVQFRYVGVS